MDRMFGMTATGRNVASVARGERIAVVPALVEDVELQEGSHFPCYLCFGVRHFLSAFQDPRRLPGLV